MPFVRPSAQLLELDTEFPKLALTEKAVILWKYLSPTQQEVEVYRPSAVSHAGDRFRKLIFELPEAEFESFIGMQVMGLENETTHCLELFVSTEGPSLTDRALVATSLLKSENLSSRALSALFTELDGNSGNLSSSIEQWIKHELITLTSPPESREKEFFLTPAGKAKRDRLIKRALTSPTLK